MTGEECVIERFHPYWYCKAHSKRILYTVELKVCEVAEVRRLKKRMAEMEEVAGILQGPIGDGCLAPHFEHDGDFFGCDCVWCRSCEEWATRCHEHQPLSVGLRPDEKCKRCGGAGTVVGCGNHDNCKDVVRCRECRATGKKAAGGE